MKQHINMLASRVREKTARCSFVHLYYSQDIQTYYTGSDFRKFIEVDSPLRMNVKG